MVDGSAISKRRCTTLERPRGRTNGRLSEIGEVEDAVVLRSANCVPCAGRHAPDVSRHDRVSYLGRFRRLLARVGWGVPLGVCSTPGRHAGAEKRYVLQEQNRGPGSFAACCAQHEFAILGRREVRSQGAAVSSGRASGACGQDGRLLRRGPGRPVQGPVEKQEASHSPPWPGCYLALEPARSLHKSQQAAVPLGRSSARVAYAEYYNSRRRAKVLCPAAAQEHKTCPYRALMPPPRPGRWRYWQPHRLR